MRSGGCEYPVQSGYGQMCFTHAAWAEDQQVVGSIKKYNLACRIVKPIIEEL